MSILGIGSWELLLIVVLVIIVLGPDRSRDAAMGFGRLLRRATRSEFWRELLQIARFMQHLPQNLMKMAELEEIQGQLAQEVASMRREIQQVAEPVQALTSNRTMEDPFRAVRADIKKAVTGTPETENRIAPAPEAPPPPPAPTPAASAPAELKAAPRPTVPPAGQARDDEMIKLVKDLTRYAEEWPTALARMAELEKAQAELAEQVRKLQHNADTNMADQAEETE